MIKLYFHIGIAKTGTTAFQRFMTMNEDSLLEAGVLYPKTGRTLYSHAHSDFHFSLRNQEHKGKAASNLDTLVRDIKVEIYKSKVECVVLSCENFAALDAQHIAKFHAAFAEFDTEVIVCLRRQDEFTYAEYAHCVMQKGYVDKPYERFGRCDNIIFYDVLLERWARVFGGVNLKVVLFADDLKRAGIAKYFLDKIGIPWRDSFVIPQINKSNITPSGEAIEARRAKNAKVAGSQADLLALDTQFSKNAFLRDERTVAFMKRFDASNREVACRYFGRDGDLF